MPEKSKSKMGRSERLGAIKEIINTKKISSQEELLNELIKKGYNVTQSTVSRDLNYLGVVRVRNYQQKEYYAIKGTAFEGNIIDPEKFKTKLRESVVSLKRAENIIVIKTFPGEAQGTAAVIDGMNFVEILGTVAGDDTIICVTDSSDNADRIIKMMQEQL
ncbi:MAG: arginine repressor [Candidatus Humimicrobiaceae bacterium]|jgi:transcriptional regulator of arginine metabolism|nr:arginine repressor [Actinomycetota bacterium]MDD5600364.1 arginine repressor [Actinomycetota bacterium]MDY0027386.1 arginine repressor [Candidatus Humimicrobiaceae bacterium]